MSRQVGIRAWSLAALAVAILAGAELADSAQAQAVPSQMAPHAVPSQAIPPQAQPEIKCTTAGATTYCSDGTQFEESSASTPLGIAREEGKPARQALGKSGPIEYQRDDLRIFGVDSRIRRLGETNYDTGQQGTLSTYSGRNCARFNTSIICD